MITCMCISLQFRRTTYKQIFGKVQSFEFLEKSPGTHIRLHSCISIIPSPTQAIDPFDIFVTTNENSSSEIAGIKRERFDWIELLDAHNDSSFDGLYSSIAALVEIQIDSFHEFFLIGTVLINCCLYTFTDMCILLHFIRFVHSVNSYTIYRSRCN